LGFNLQINIEKIFGTGEAKYVICNAAKNLEADTLVMGSHGYGFFKRYQIHQLFNIF
jgi:nucleotide-binding universal stress UspA family protein